MAGDAAAQPIDLVSANERNFASFLALQRELDDAEVQHDGTATWVANRDPMFWFNMAVRMRLTSQQADGFIEGVLATHGWLGTDVLVWLSPLATPADLPARLEARGFARLDTAPAMAADLCRLAAPALPQGVSIERVSDAATLGTLVTTLVEGYGLEGAEAIWSRFFALAGLEPEGAVHNFLGRLNDRPACCATIHLAEGVAGVYCVATLPDARRRGLAGAVTASALAYARRLGYRYAVLQSSAMGESLYRAMGFDNTFTYQVYGWSPQP